MASSHESSNEPSYDGQEASYAGNSYSGKWFILGIMATALAMASFGWWFRFQATNQTAQFWGPEAALLIRDAPQVFAYRWPEGMSVEDWASGSKPNAGEAAMIEIAAAPGITHLRAALLEDRSFVWNGPAAEPANEPLTSLGYGLQFVDSSQHSELLLGFSEDCRTLVRIAANGEPSVHISISSISISSEISSEPISAGLKVVFGEVFGEAAGEATGVALPAASESSR